MNLSAELVEVVNDKDNNFNLLRFGAAVTVIVSHSFILTGNMPTAWPKIFGFLAVNCFFIISGFLVCKSLLDRNSFVSFIWARVLRVYPALIMAVLFCALLVGPINTTVPLVDYFTSSLTYRFIFTNGTLLGGSVENYLPGVFTLSTTSNKVNAPLWTLFYEVYMYLSLAFLGLICGLRTKLNICLFSRTVYVLSGILFTLFIADIGFKCFHNHFVSSMVRFGALFGMGVSLYLARTKIKLNLLVIFAMLVLIALASLDRIIFNGITYLFLGYILLYLAYVPKGLLLGFNRLGDYSYGLYIFAYPIQQTLVNHFPAIETFHLLMLSLLFSLILAILSWHLLEARMLKLKSIWS